MVMRGQEVFRKAVRVTVDSARASLERAKVSIDDIALFVPHQANLRIMDAVGIPAGPAPGSDRRPSSTAPATPVRRRYRWRWWMRSRKGRLHDGDLILLAGFGAGMTWASAVWRWGGAGRATDVSGHRRVAANKWSGRRPTTFPLTPAWMEDPMADKADSVDDEAFEKFKECAVEVLHVEPEKVTPDASFADDLDADSLDLVELVMALEEQFGITVDESELEGVSTVGQAFDLVSSKL